MHAMQQNGMKASNQLRREIGLFGLSVFFVLTTGVNAQKPLTSLTNPDGRSRVKTFQLNSKLLGRPVPYAVFLPLSYNADRSTRFPVVYLLHGLSGSYKTFAENPDRLKDFPKRDSIFVFVEGGMSFFTDRRDDTE